jgi:hypothetical protein
MAPAAALLPVLTAAIGAGATIFSATQKPDAPDAPKAGLPQGAIQTQNSRRAAAVGRQSTILGGATGGSKLGQVGG